MKEEVNGVLEVSDLIKILVQHTTEIRKDFETLLTKNEDKKINLYDLFVEFKNLISTIDKSSFADDLAQAVTFYLVFLQYNQTIHNIFETNPLNFTKSNLHFKIFYDFLFQTNELNLSSIDKLTDLLKTIEINEIFHNFRQSDAEREPLLHFYELFLKEYDKERRVKRGVFYTPNSIASFIVRSVDYLLRKEFDYPDGLADISMKPIKILDPAAGTGTFLIHIINKIKKIIDGQSSNYKEGKQKQLWNDYVSNHLLSNIVGYEIMLTPFIISHLLIIQKLIESGFFFKSPLSSHLELCNAFLKDISSENFSVILGNPPYQVNSVNNTAFIEELMQLYKEGVKEERYIKPLSDDYIKFFRLAHYLIDYNGFGIIALITNHGYLSGLIHRGMREQLLQSFDKIYILDLHGNRHIGEISPDGSEDQNVFDIQQGTCISFLVKLKNSLPRAEIYHLDLWGFRENKLEILKKNDLSTLSWNQIHPAPPNYLFIPHDTLLEMEYNSYPSLTDIFQQYSIGILTNRDWLTIDFTKKELENKIRQFFAHIEDPKISNIFPQLTQTWWDYCKLSHLNSDIVVKNITKCLFRPFDIRYIVYHPLLLNRARKEIMDHVDGKENLVLISSRHYRKKNFNSCFISEYIVEQKAGESTRGSYSFPLFVYNNEEQQLNLSSIAKDYLLNLHLGLDDSRFIGYIYAILHSNLYRQRYQEYLRLDFPRIPFTKNEALFKDLAQLGFQLMDIHLLKRSVNENMKFSGNGNNIIQNKYPKFQKNRIYINESQYFQEVSQDIWDFLIGGYQICYKWLRDRRNRILTTNDINFYQKIITAISETIQIMEKIDLIILNNGSLPIN